MKEFFKSLFGPSKKEIWQQLSREIDGEYIEKGYFTSPKVTAQHKNWNITLDTYQNDDTTYTRISSPYISKHGFQFRIYRHGMLSDLGKFFGMQDIEVGDTEFDEAFIIKGNDPYKVQLLFESEAIRNLLQSLSKIDLKVKDGSPLFQRRKTIKPTENLHFQAIGVIKDIEQLKLLFELFAETLNQLCAIGAAYEEDTQ